MKKVKAISNEKIIGTFEYGKYRICVIDNEKISTIWIRDPQKVIMGAMAFGGIGHTVGDLEDILNSNRDVIDEYIKDYEKVVRSYLE